jgi:uncharacterized membrane protein
MRRALFRCVAECGQRHEWRFHGSKFFRIPTFPTMQKREPSVEMREPDAVAENHSARPPVERRAYHKPRSVDDLTERNVQTIVQLEESARQERTTSDRVVDAITEFCGTIAFVWLHIIWFTAWVGLNLWLGKRAFDMPPFFWLTGIVALEAILLVIFILHTQRRQSQLNERRDHLNLQISLLIEQENTKMLQMLNQIAHAVGAEFNNDPDVRILEEATRPERLLEQIDQSIEEVEKSKQASDGATDA